MILGNVAPAPFSRTVSTALAATAAPSSAARARKRLVFTGGCPRVRVSSEHELRLNQRLIGGRPATLRLYTIEVRKHTDVGAQLVRGAGDDPRVAIVGDAVVRICHVHASDDGDLAAAQVIDAKGADDTASDRAVLHRDVVARDRELLCAVDR